MKIRPIWWILILLVGLLTALWYLSGRQPDKMTELLADRDFAIKDTDKITKIFLAGRNQESITLEKVNEVWMLNGKYKAAENPVKNLLQSIRDIRLQSIPPKGHMKSIMEGIAVYGIKVELYGEANKLLKTYYVGGTTQHEYGTYYYMENGTQPYVMEIPHFAGNLRERYKLDELDWRDKSVFEFTASDVIRLSVEYPHDVNRSFLIKKEDSEYRLFDISNEQKIQGVSKTKILESYLQSFEGVGAEDIQNKHPMKDEIIKLLPYCIISVQKKDSDEILSYKFFPVNHESDGKFSYNYKPELFDKEFFRLHVSRSTGDFLLVQYPNVVNLFKHKSDFL